ncbi:MAG: hypothetical protein IK137_02410 [Bacilli bacterium]|nr:hypothetical protein [Bacilli bacterium]
MSSRSKSLTEIFISGVISLAIILLLKACFTPKPDNGQPYETLSMNDNIDNETEGDLEEYFETTVEYDEDLLEVTFAPGEHIVAVGIDDPIGSPKVFEGHPGYKPVGISASTYGRLLDMYYAGYILFENVVEVKANATSVDSKGKYSYNNFGTPVDYEITSYGENSYDTYQHIIVMPISIDGPRTQIDSVEGYEAVGIATEAYGRYLGRNGGSCILYVNTVPVENCVDEYYIPKFGTPIEKQKVLEK